MTMKPITVFIGWDEREAVAYHVCAHSLIRRSSQPLQIVPLVQTQLRNAGIYARPEHDAAATAFSYTRFLVPFLSDYVGRSIFIDCDMVLQEDIAELMALVEREQCRDLRAVYCCQHDYMPKAAVKMDGQKQVAYPRKNWSSVMVFENSLCRALTPEYVNTATGQQLHRFEWLEDGFIGSLPLDWNWLVDEYAPNTAARNLHYTNGGPWFAERAGCDMADIWLAERDRALGSSPLVGTR